MYPCYPVSTRLLSCVCFSRMVSPPCATSASNAAAHQKQAVVPCAVLKQVGCPGMPLAALCQQTRRLIPPAASCTAPVHWRRVQPTLKVFGHAPVWWIEGTTRMR